MTCHTDNAQAQKAYLHFIEQIEPRLKPRQFKLAQLYLAQPLRSQLPKARYEVFDRDTQLHVELLRPENGPLATEEAKLSQRYQELSGSLTGRLRAPRTTLPHVGPFLDGQDRPWRR